MNTTVKPFDDINVRKAVIAGLDRNALRLTRGGELLGDIATHFLAAGHGRLRGGRRHEGHRRRLPLQRTASRSPEVSAEYFKEAGYASGKYEGTEKILMVGSNAGVAAKTAEVAKENLERMGFKVQMRLVQQQTMYTRYCNTPSANVAVCPNVGWLKDFADGQTMLVADVRRQEHPRAGQLQLGRARRPGDQRGDRQGRAAPQGGAPGGLGRDRQDDRRADARRSRGSGTRPR